LIPPRRDLIRVAYIDPALRPTLGGLVNAELNRHALLRAQEWTLLSAAVQNGRDLPDKPSKSKLPGDPRSLRGIPVTGRGIGGVIRGTRPGDCSRCGRPLPCPAHGWPDEDE
jgi:hypothetical protein